MFSLVTMFSTNHKIERSLLCPAIQINEGFLSHMVVENKSKDCKPSKNLHLKKFSKHRGTLERKFMNSKSGLKLERAKGRIWYSWSLKENKRSLDVEGKPVVTQVQVRPLKKPREFNKVIIPRVFRKLETNSYVHSNQ